MPEERFRVSRRDVLRGAGAAALIGATVGRADAEEPPAQPGIERTGPGPTRMTLEVNGAKKTISVEPRTTLLDALRDRIGLTGTKRVCDRGSCGGCTVWVDGRVANSCMMLAVDAVGRSVTTIEGLAQGDRLHPVQAAFVKHDALMCGFCTPGMIMSCAALVKETPKPTADQVRHAIAGNLCRCGTYPHILDAMREVAR